MEQKENLCRPPEYTAEMVKDMYEKEIKRAHRLNEILEIIGYEYDLDRLSELVEADRKGLCVVLPKVDNDSMKSFIDSLEDIFSEWSYEDKSVGLFGMSDGEKELASALMNALKGENK